MRHVVMTSGGEASYVTGLRVAERHGTADLTLLFADTKGDNPSPHAGEDADTYRFLEEAAADVGGTFVRLNAGEDIWQVFRRRRRIGSGYAANCSFELKQRMCREWLEAECDPGTTTVYIGIDYTEADRCEPQRAAYAHRLSGCARPRRCREPVCRLRQGCREHRPCTPDDPCTARLERPWPVAFPLIEWKPMLDKPMIHAITAERGIAQQRLYRAGYPHANCGGFCVKAGKGQMAMLLRDQPERYRYHEEQEQLTREHIGTDVAVLSESRPGGRRVPLTLRTFREQIESQTALFDPDDLGGCQSCFTDGPR